MDTNDGTPKAEHEVVAFEREGIEVLIDRTYVRSWPGLVAAADMQREDLDMAKRFTAQITYYRGACPNIDDVTAALVAARPGEEVTGSDVMTFVGMAIRDNAPKN